MNGSYKYSIEKSVYKQLPYDNDQYNSLYMVMDSLGNILISGQGLQKYDGNIWTQISLPSNNINDWTLPIMVSKDGTIYTKVVISYPSVDGYGQNQDIGIVTYKDNNWTYWNEFDSPFAIQIEINERYLSGFKSIAESQNGDIWMVLDNELWRYRPSLGGYP